MLSFAFCVCAMIGHNMNEALEELNKKDKCAKIGYLKDIFSNEMMDIHLMIIKVMFIIMLTTFTIVFFFKLIPVLSFLICPMFQIKVGKLCKGKPAEIKDSIHIS